MDPVPCVEDTLSCPVRAEEVRKLVLQDDWDTTNDCAGTRDSLMHKIDSVRLESLVTVEHRGNYQDALNPRKTLLLHLGVTVGGYNVLHSV